METTLEIRWFIRGMPPVVVQHWFKLECPGKLLEDEPDREDLYAAQIPIDRLRACLSSTLEREAVNLKLRQGNLELKLRQQELGTYQFGNADDAAIWSGKIERWSKLGQQDLKDAALLSLEATNTSNWLAVCKRREQKIAQNVKIELTYLKVKSDRWWSLAFEMPQNTATQLSKQHFREVIEQAAQSYQGPKLLDRNSYSYSRWQTRFT